MEAFRLFPAWLSSMLQKWFGWHSLEGHGSSSAAATPKVKIESGMVVEKQSLTWKVRNVPAVLADESLLKLQQIDFIVGRSIGQEMKLTAYLKVLDRNGAKCLTICCQLKEVLSSGAEYLCSEIKFEVYRGNDEHAKNWRKIRNETVPIMTLKTLKRTRGWGSEAINLTGNNRPLPKNLKFQITFKLYSPAKLTYPLDFTQKEHQVRFTAKAQKEIEEFRKNPIAGDVKIVSSDRMEFWMLTGILGARSPVFKAMLEADMLEATNSRIELPDITGKTLAIFLHFVYTGELLPDWKDEAVIAELMNAAAKYMFADLLEFLEVVVGDICTMKNVFPLLLLANRLSLKKGEAGLLKFIREQGANSSENFFQFVNATHGMAHIDSCAI